MLSLCTIKPPFLQPHATSSSLSGPKTNYNKEVDGWMNRNLAAKTPDPSLHSLYDIIHSAHLPQT